MSNVYRVSSTAKVEQMKTELSVQLSALRTEIEENQGLFGRVSLNSYSSVAIPKDVSIFNVEREHILRRGLQVAEALPLLSQADLMQMELDSCLSLEYTPESLPLLLHQFYVDRSYQLVHIKYLLMLRWRRFCCHSRVIEKMYPYYKNQMSYLVSEYEDAVQRARKLAVSRENILTGKGNPIDVVNQQDVVIYLRWLVCHLHSVKKIHNFLPVIQSIPAEEKKDSSETCLPEDSHSEILTGLDNEKVPIHTITLEEFKTELLALVSHFHLPYDTQTLKTTSDEMELFSVVSREFRLIFRKQDIMKTFPQYDGSEASQSHWGRKSASMALRKEANWISFIQVKPKLDPWQQKLVTKITERKNADEILRMHCKFLQISDLSQVSEGLKDYAANVCDSKVKEASSVASQTRKCPNTSQIWSNMYKVSTLSQDTDNDLLKPDVKKSHEKNITRSKSYSSQTNNDSYSYMSSVQLLGLEDSSKDDGSDIITTKGAYLSLIYLRHLKIRELRRVSLGLLNYLRSVERTLTFDTAGLSTEGGDLCSSAEETGWMNAARGGTGTAGGLGSLGYSYSTPVEYKVQCSEFMEFSEVENLHDFYITEEGCVHTQDHRGLYVVYDAALKDLDELENLLILVGSHYILRAKGEQPGNQSRGSCPSSTRTDTHSWARTEIDRVAVLLDLWSCETAFLERKVQLLNCYYEAYQHVAGSEERFALAHVITDIMHRRPQIDLGAEYFVQAYKAEISCLQSHQQVIKAILDCQIDQQRQYLQRIWRGGQTDTALKYGLPPNYVPKYLVSLVGSSQTLMNVFLLEVHTSLYLASQIYQALGKAHTELCNLHRLRGGSQKVHLEKKLLLQVLQYWQSLVPPGALYNPQIRKELFSDVFLEDPCLVIDFGLSFIKSVEERELRQGKEQQLFAVETFSKFLELVTIRHRLIESSAETAHLARLYKQLASELGFDEFNLYLRPVQFEFAVEKDKVVQRPLYMTSLLEDSSCVDGYTPSSLPLGIQEVDENHIGRFSFSLEEAVMLLMTTSGIENLQVTLACQLTQKNGLFCALKQACHCYWAEIFPSPTEESFNHIDEDKTKSSESCASKGASALIPLTDHMPKKESKESLIGPKQRLAESFVSIQLEKAGLRDNMLNMFIKKKQALGSLMKDPEEVAKIKRGLILRFCQNFSRRISQCCVRGQIVACYNSLTSLLDELPEVRKSHFIIGQAKELLSSLGSNEPHPDPRTFQQRPLCLISTDGTILLNLWFIPHYTEVLHMFKGLDEMSCSKALHQTLEIVSSLHDIVYYLVSFAQLGNKEMCPRIRKGKAHLTADWGGIEGIGAELLEIQRQVDSLADPSSLKAVGHLLQLRRQVLFLQFDMAVRHLIRESFISSGDTVSYESVTDNMANALPLLSDSISSHGHSSLLPVPQPLEPQGQQAKKLYPWRCFLACHGLHPLEMWGIPPIEYSMQLCLSGLRERSRMEANAAILGVSLLMEDVLNSEGEAAPVRLHDNRVDDLHGKPGREEDSSLDDKKNAKLIPFRDPIQVLTVLKSFMLLSKQLEVFKESWGRRHLYVEKINTLPLHRQFVKLYRSEIHYPSMKALAQHLGKEKDFEALVSEHQPLLPPTGTSEVDIRTWQLLKLLECTECDMIKVVQQRLATELTLVMSEKARQDTGLPTELWKKSPLKHSLSPERPQIVENFIQLLMELAEKDDRQVRFSEAHLQQCLTSLGCSVMERERRSFLLYSQFYEQILQQETKLLYHREQDIKNFEMSQSVPNPPYHETVVLCRGMMLEISALRARLTHLEDEKQTLEKQISVNYRQRYNSLVHQLFSTCIQLKARLDEYHMQMDQNVSRLVNKVRREGVDNIIKLKNKYGSNKDNDALEMTKLKKEEVYDLSVENSQLTGLLCKMKALNHWRRVVGLGKCTSQLLLSQKRELTCYRDALKVKMMSHEEVVLLQEELEATKKALAECQKEHNYTKRLLSKQTVELRETRHRSDLEAKSRKELDSYRWQRLELLREEVGDKERELREISTQLDQGSRESQLLRQRSAKEIRQVRSQLHQERSLKLEAFEQVDKLQGQVYDCEATLSRSTSNPVRGKMSSYMLSLSRSNGKNTAAAKRANLDDSETIRDLQMVNTLSYSNTKLGRPKTDPSRLRARNTDALLPELADRSFKPFHRTTAADTHPLVESTMPDQQGTLTS